MASLRKRKGSNVWQAQYYVPDANTRAVVWLADFGGEVLRRHKAAWGLALWWWKPALRLSKASAS
jgi:hypothetical protein